VADSEWFEGLSADEAKEDRVHLRVWVGRVLVLLGILIGVVLATDAYAVPVAEAGYNQARIVLTDEKCKVKEITNLPRRAIWTERGKTFEGCFELHQWGFVVAYFDDATVAIIPLDMFKPITGA
jgi:hypothetical protein